MEEPGERIVASYDEGIIKAEDIENEIS